MFKRRNIKIFHLMLVVALVFSAVYATLIDTKRAAAQDQNLTLCMNGEAAPEGTCQFVHDVDEAPEQVRFTCGGLLGVQAKRDCIIRECARYDCPSNPNAPEGPYTGNVLCSNGQYGSATYEDNGNCEQYDEEVTVVRQDIARQCGNIATSGDRAICVINANNKGDNFEADCKEGLEPGDCGITSYLRDFINVLSGLVGIVIVIMVTVGGIQYSAARDNPQVAAAAKQRIFNAVLALVAYMFAFAFLQWLVPGGIF